MTSRTNPDVWRVDLARTARLAWAHRAWLLKLNAAIAVAALAGVLLMPRWYVSSVTLVPAPQEGLLSGTAADASGLALLAAGVQMMPQDQLRAIAASRAVADSVVRTLDLRSRWDLNLVDQARRRLASRTRYTTPKDGRLVIEIDARTAQEAHDIADACARYTRLESVRLRTSLAGQRRTYLHARLADVDRELAAAAESVRAFEEGHRAVSLGDQARATLEAIEKMRGQYIMLQTELAAARRYFADGSPEVQTLSDRAGELQRQMAALEGKGDSMLPGGAELPALKQEYFRLTREQASVLAVSELLRRVYEQARVEESNPVPSFSVLDAPDLPERPARPPRARTLALVMMLSAAGSLLSLEWRERARPRVAHGGEGTMRPPAEDGGGPDVERRAA